MFLFQGLMPTLVGYGLEGALKFGTYEMCCVRVEVVLSGGSTRPPAGSRGQPRVACRQVQAPLRDHDVLVILQLYPRLVHRGRDRGGGALPGRGGAHPNGRGPQLCRRHARGAPPNKPREWAVRLAKWLPGDGGEAGSVHGGQAGAPPPLLAARSSKPRASAVCARPAPPAYLGAFCRRSPSTSCARSPRSACARSRGCATASARSRRSSPRCPPRCSPRCSAIRATRCSPSSTRARAARRTAALESKAVAAAARVVAALARTRAACGRPCWPRR